MLVYNIRLMDGYIEFIEVTYVSNYIILCNTCKKNHLEALRINYNYITIRLQK